MKIRVRLAAGLLAAMALGLSDCSSTTTAPRPEQPPATSSTTDVVFAQSMIPHHEQAVEMADLALSAGTDASPQVRQLAEQIKAAQAPEIQQMTAWLTGWGAPTAMPGSGASGDLGTMDHSGHDMGGVSVSGMMSAEDMQSLSEASGQHVDRQWLQMMIAHHEGAISMAEQMDERTSQYPQVIALANQIVGTQQKEITTMQEMLAR